MNMLHFFSLLKAVGTGGIEMPAHNNKSSAIQLIT